MATVTAATAMLGGLSTGSRPGPDWSEAVRELRRKGVTRQRLWLEYLECHPGCYGCSRFCDRLQDWQDQTETTMP